MDTNTTTNQPKAQSNFLSPIGAVITIICFFLPWAKGCDGSKTLGSDMGGALWTANRFAVIENSHGPAGDDIGGALWLVLIAAIAILAIFFIHHNNGEDHKAKPIITLSSIIGLGAIVLQFLIEFSEVKRVFRHIDLGDMVKLMDVGAFGAVIGLILALVGGMALGRRGDK